MIHFKTATASEFKSIKHVYAINFNMMREQIPGRNIINKIQIKKQETKIKLQTDSKTLQILLLGHKVYVLTVLNKAKATNKKLKISNLCKINMKITRS